MTVIRNMSTPESREFWARAEQSAGEVSGWPAWKRAGINVAPIRSEARAQEGTVTYVLKRCDESYFLRLMFGGDVVWTTSQRRALRFPDRETVERAMRGYAQDARVVRLVNSKGGER